MNVMNVRWTGFSGLTGDASEARQEDSGPAADRIMQSEIEEVVVTDSVPLNGTAEKVPKITVLSVAELLARGIQSIHEETSISELFI